MLSTELGPNGGYLTDAELDDASPAGARIVLLYADHDTRNALQTWAEAAGFDLTQKWGGEPVEPSEFDFHVTLLATKNDVAIPLTDHLVEPIEAMANGFDVLGLDADTPVLKLGGVEGLQFMREYFVDTYDAEPTFAEFRPHVSLSYAWSGEPALEDLELPDFPLVFDRLCVKPFEPEQKSTPLEQLIAKLERI